MSSPFGKHLDIGLWFMLISTNGANMISCITGHWGLAPERRWVYTTLNEAREYRKCSRQHGLKLKVTSSLLPGTLHGHSHQRKVLDQKGAVLCSFCTGLNTQCRAVVNQAQGEQYQSIRQQEAKQESQKSSVFEIVQTFNVNAVYF